MPTVAELLYESIAAHQRSKQKGKTRDMTALRLAYELRKQAIASDPDRADPAWQAEQSKTAAGRDTHDELMTFYREKLR